MTSASSPTASDGDGMPAQPLAKCAANARTAATSGATGAVAIRPARARSTHQRQPTAPAAATRGNSRIFARAERASASSSARCTVLPRDVLRYDFLGGAELTPPVAPRPPATLALSAGLSSAPAPLASGACNQATRAPMRVPLCQRFSTSTSLGTPPTPRFSTTNEATQFAQSAAVCQSPPLVCRCHRNAAAKTSPAPVGSTSVPDLNAGEWYVSSPARWISQPRSPTDQPRRPRR